MSEKFAATATKWCARAAQILGWSPGTFWSATPTELVSSLTSLDAHEIAPITRDDVAQLIESESHG